MIVVHHLEDSRSQRVLWLLEELGLDYRVERYRRDPKTRLAPASLKAVHPLGKSPVVVDGDVTVAETGAIVEYLIGRGDGAFAAPEDPARRRDCVYWTHFAEGSMMPQLILRLFFSRIKTAPMPFFVRPVAARISDAVMDDYVNPNIEAQLDFIDATLKDRAWFAGDAPTGADVMMSFPLEAAAANDGPAAGRPAIAAWLARVRARPAYRRALERGGPYAFA